MEENMDMSKSKSKITIIIIFLLLLIIAGLAGYIVFNKEYIKLGKQKETEKKELLNKNIDNDNNLEEDEIAINLTEEEQENINSIFEVLIATNSEYKGNGEITTDNYSYFLSEISRLSAVYFNTSSIDGKSYPTNVGSGSVSCIDFEELSELSMEIFGKSFTMDTVKNSTNIIFDTTNCPDGTIGSDAGFMIGIVKVISLTKDTNINRYIALVEVIEENSSIYQFSFEIDDEKDLSTLKFDDFTNLVGKRIK